MNKTELIEHIANQAEISKAAASKALTAFTGGVTKALKKGGRVSIVGFGTFSAVKRKARVGFNPATQQKIKIKAKTVAKFKAGKALADKL